MRIFLAVFVCLLFAVHALGQGGENAGGDVRVEKTTIARQEADGTITESPETFRPGDIPVYCYVNISEGSSVTLKMVLTAVRAVGLRPGTTVSRITYRTNEGDTEITFTARPAEKWAPGDYRVDIYLDGSKADSVNFEVAGDKRE